MNRYINYHVTMSNLTEIENALRMTKDKSNLALRTAINNAAKEIEKGVTKGASKRYALEEGGVQKYRDITEIKKATTKNLTATITAKDKTAFDLYDYKLSDRTYYPGSAGAPKWVKARQLKRGRLQKLELQPGSSDSYKAFVIRYKNGKDSSHIALAQRIPGKHMQRNSKKEAVRSLYATSKPKGEEVVYREEYEAKVEDMLAEAIQKQVERLLPVTAST